MGFDYVELSAVALRKAEPASLAGIPIYSTCQFFPWGAKFFADPPFDWRGYAPSVIECAASFGVKVMVIGSGTHRASSPELPPAQAQPAFFDICAGLQEIATPYEVKIAPESLSRDETDVGNNLEVLAAQLDNRGVGYTLDTYHALSEWDAGKLSPPTPQELRSRIAIPPTHVHLSNRERSVPTGADTEVLAILARISEMGFDGGISLECGDLPFQQEFGEAVANLRNLLPA